MESKDEKGCHQCPCSRIQTECTEFQKVVDLCDAGVVIYRHSMRDDEAIYLASDFEMTMTNTDVFIIHNTKDAEVTSADIVPALVQNKVDCPRCQHIMDHAQRLLKNVSIVDKKDVIGICDHCKIKGKYRTCVDCTKVVKKFMTSVHIRSDYEETKERLKTWLKKIETMLTGVPSDERRLKVKSRSQTDLRIDKLRQYSERVVHVPDVEQMFKPEKYRPTSSKEAPGSKSVYFKERDEKLLIDTESAKVERTGKEDFVQAEKANVDKDHVPKTIELEPSSDQQIILDQKKLDTNELVSKTQPVDISSSTVTKAKLPKDLSAEVSTINAIKSEKSKSRQTLKGALKKSKPSESRLRAWKYHSEDDLTTNIGDVRVQEPKIPKKGFKYFFPKEAKIKRPRRDLTSSVLIKDTQDKIKDQAEKKQAEARKRKVEENENKTVAKEEKRAKMDEQTAKTVEASHRDGKKVKADGKKLKSDGKNVKSDGKKKISKEVGREAVVSRVPEVRQKAEVRQPAKTEGSLPLESKGELKPKSQTKETPTDIIMQERIESVGSPTMEKQKSPDKRSGEIQSAIPKDATGSIKQDAPLKDIDSKIKEKSEPGAPLKDKDLKIKEKPGQGAPLKDTDSKMREKSDQGAPLKDKDSKIKEKLEKKGEKSDQLMKAKNAKQKQTELDLLKKALASQQSKTQDTEQKPQQEKEEKELKETESKIKREKETAPKGLKNKQEESKKGKEDKGKSDKSKKEEMTLLKMALDKRAKEKDEELMMKKAQEEAEKKARDLATKIAEQAPKALDTTYIPPSLEHRTESEDSALDRKAPTMKDLDMKDITVRKPSYDDLILRLVKLKKAAANARKNKDLTKFGDSMFSTANTVRHKNHLRKVSNCEFCLDSDLELDLDSYFRRKEKEEQAGLAEMILGDKIIKKTRKPQMKKDENKVPVLFMSASDELTDKMRPGMVPKVVLEEEPPPNTTVSKSRAAVPAGDQETSKGVIRYALSDRTFIEKGWTMLPTEKVVRKMNVYRMRPAHPEFDWFERNKNKRLIPYETGEKFAEFDDNGRGRLFYKNGKLALDYYDAEETNAQQRFVMYSSGEPDERGRSRPVTVLATFDYLGNGVVFDHGGKIRLKYNQTEGVVLDRGIGPVSHWKWHTLNDPPVLQQVMIDTQMAQKDPAIVKLGGSNDDADIRPDNDDMLAIEFDNFIKEKSKKSSQKFKPFQIKMKALKINEQFSLRVLDQATVYLIFREASVNLKFNIGMLLDHQEIIDTDTAEVGEVSSNVERLPARSDSLAALQNSMTLAQRHERMRTERERRLRPQEPSSSADQLTAGTSRPLRPPLLTAPAAASNTSPGCPCKSRKPSTNNLYYDTRLI